MRSGHGVGKTTLFSWIVLWGLCCRPDIRIPVASNSQDQLRQTIWPEISKWHKKLPEELRSIIDIQAEKIVNKLDPESCFAVARTASKDNPEALQGFHGEFVLFLVDEASGVPEIVFEIALGALSTDNKSEGGAERAMFILAGNPTRNSGYFHASHNKNANSYHCFHVPSFDVQRATGHIERVEETYGRGSNAWRIRVEGRFPIAADEVIIPLEHAEAAVDREVKPIPVMPIWGLDVARFGDDRSALAKRQGNVLLEPIQSWRNKDSIQLASIIRREWENTENRDRPYAIMVDVIGVGAGVYDILKNMGLPAHGVNVGESPSSMDNCLRLRDELWRMGGDWFKKRDVSIPNDPVLISELTNVTYTFTVTGKFAAERKEDMKKRGLDSPDLADAFLLTFAGPTIAIEDAYAGWLDEPEPEYSPWAS